MESIKSLSKFWKGKKVFITGHTGFKGSWLTILLNMLGADIYGYSLKPEKNSLFLKANCKKFLKRNVYSDINDRSDMIYHRVGWCISCLDLCDVLGYAALRMFLVFL